MLKKNKYSEILGITTLVGLYGIYNYYYYQTDIKPKIFIKESNNILASYSNSNNIDNNSSEIDPTDYESTDDETTYDESINNKISDFEYV